MKREIQFSLLSRYKVPLMGLSMLMIMLCHTNVGFSAEKGIISPFFSEILQTGVGIFFCLSGLGCYYSFHRTPSVTAFYKKRLLRILPPYLLVIAVYGAFRFLSGADGSIKDYLWLYSPCSFWVDGYLAEWFISAILVLYLLFPVFYHVINRVSVLGLGLLLMANVLAVSVLHVYGTGSLCVINEIFFSRVPSFLIGIYLGKWLTAEKEKFTVSYRQIVLIFTVSLLICMVNYWLNRAQFGFIHRIMTAPLGISGSLLLGAHWTDESKLSRQLVQKLTVVGGMTLELYLTHEKILHVLQIVLRSLSVHFGYFAFTLLSNVLAFELALVCAAIVKRIAGFCTKSIMSK